MPPDAITGRRMAIRRTANIGGNEQEQRELPIVKDIDNEAKYNDSAFYSDYSASTKL